MSLLSTVCFTYSRRAVGETGITNYIPNMLTDPAYLVDVEKIPRKSEVLTQRVAALLFIVR